MNVLQGPRDEDLPGGGGHRYTETGVDRTPPRGGNATAGTSAGSTAAAERWTETKRRGPPRSVPGSDPLLTDRPLTQGEASTTGVAKRALALEPGRFRYAYRTGRAARRGDVTRGIENRMETITSMAQARGDAFSSSRTSRQGASRFFVSPKVTFRGRIRVNRPVCVPPSVAVLSLDTTPTDRFPPSDDVDGIVPISVMASMARAKTQRCSSDWRRPYSETPLFDQVERCNEMPVRRKNRIHPLHPTSEATPPVVADSTQVASNQRSSESNPRHLSAAIVCTYRTAIQGPGRYDKRETARTQISCQTIHSDSASSARPHKTD